MTNRNLETHVFSPRFCCLKAICTSMRWRNVGSQREPWRESHWKPGWCFSGDISGATRREIVWFLEDAELSSCSSFFCWVRSFQKNARNYEASSPSVLTTLTFLQSNQEPTSTWLCNWIFLWPIWPSGQNVGVKLLNPNKPPLASQIYSFWEGIYFPGVRIKWWLVTVP